jgi:PAS domain S-box-containing protein
VLLVASFPTTVPRPVLFVCLLLFSCVTSLWKVTLPLPVSNGSTLSTSYAAALMALVLLGVEQAMVIGIAGVWTQCTIRVKERYPWHRTLFSTAAEAITVHATAIAYSWLDGPTNLLDAGNLPKALVGVIPTYFLMNTGLVAAAIGLSTRRSSWGIWRDDFLWSGPSFMVAGAAGATAAVVIEHGNQWLAILMLAPVYLTYRTYRVFLGRIEDQRRHVEETQRMHSETLDALLQARRAEQALAQEKERLAVTLKSVGDGVITTDLNGTILLINRVAEALTGWTQEEAIDKPLDTVFQAVDPQTRARCANSLSMMAGGAGHHSVSRCTLLVSKQLTEHPIEEIAAPLRDGAGRTIGMVVAFRDISDALKAQAEAAKTSKVASLGLLAGGIARDFNNILMAIMGNVSIARVTTPPGTAARALEEAQQACVRARQLTWQLLTFSRGSVPVKKTTAVSRIVEESAVLALRGSNVQHTFEIAPDLWPVAADESQLVQVFTNVLTNARQAMPSGGTVVIRAENIFERDTRWEYALSVQTGRYVRISVTDSGIGIPEENLPRIFDPYFSTKQHGSGLGLATAHSIIKNHGGYVSVKSKPGQGTMLQVNLPAFDAAELGIAVNTRPAAGAGRILVMDDEATIRNLAVNMLKFLGHDAEVAEDGASAVEHYKRALMTGRPFDAVLLDLVVPGGMGGREAIELLNEIDPSVNAVIVSGYAQDATLTEFQSYGFKASMAKPYTLEELGTTLHSIMATGKWRVH